MPDPDPASRVFLRQGRITGAQHAVESGQAAFLPDRMTVEGKRRSEFLYRHEKGFLTE